MASTLKQIFIAHPVEFAAKSLKHFGEQEGVEVYILDNLDDFSYLIADLVPQALIIHQDLLEDNLSSIKREIAQYPELHTIIIVKSAENELRSEFPLQIIEPFGPENFISIIQQMLVSGNKTH